MEKIYNLSDERRIVVKESKIEIQDFRAGYSYPSGAFCGYSWHTELILTRNEFEQLKKVLTNS